MINLREKIEELFRRFKFPLLIFAAGLLLMLLPGTEQPSVQPESESTVLAQILSNSRGVGSAAVLISDKGVVVVCQGADDAKVRLEIIRAIASYTGYSSDRITILKMADKSEGG